MPPRAAYAYGNKDVYIFIHTTRTSAVAFVLTDTLNLRDSSASRTKRKQTPYLSMLIPPPAVLRPLVAYACALPSFRTLSGVECICKVNIFCKRMTYYVVKEF